MKAQQKTPTFCQLDLAINYILISSIRNYIESHVIQILGEATEIVWTVRKQKAYVISSYNGIYFVLLISSLSACALGFFFCISLLCC